MGKGSFTGLTFHLKIQKAMTMYNIMKANGGAAYQMDRDYIKN